jgi:hypothetical protein
MFYLELGSSMAEKGAKSANDGYSTTDTALRSVELVLVDICYVYLALVCCILTLIAAATRKIAAQQPASVPAVS